MSTNNSFNPREHLIQIKSGRGEHAKSSDYLPVQFRLVWFREQCPQGTISTELVHMDLDKEVESEVMQWDNETRRMKSVTKHGFGVAVFKATITDGNGGASTGFGSEKASDFGDFLEKAETKAIGRALAALGYGTQFAPELNEEHRVVDAPVEMYLSLEQVKALKDDWVSVCGIKETEIATRWEAFKTYIHNSPVDDQHLTNDFKNKADKYLAPRRKAS